ncbi:DegT/DnrJ/EryC1/StrS aminotransferase family protein [Kitasatospora sp. A2-31]|uniref:DegT/DnrJ/EryC1/StrS family aminotransferase n=1 Tax=Kitasatospora sp. A2-31 TaxID=2916414 RepID=UPI001EEAAB29|nr:DegT/DnrJ/EryC1/StrS aminotransferase family protein [Kitasatospora sp. A2-31]MCG6497853.1 DegT/DnrJ/EryC1/StrS aminotransferase family protein [Kitasatospora sp. A2-31]
MGVPAARIVFDEIDRSAVADAVTEILATGALTLGPWTERFEQAFAAEHGAPYAVAVASGTAALEIALRTVDVRDRDVVVPAVTFYATAAAVVHAGGRPVIADVDAQTLALSPATLEAALTPATAAVVLVHIGGLVTPEVDALRAICDRRGVPLVEDAAHAHGSSHDGRAAGTFGLAGAFSFYPTKVTTSGEGGMILTDSAELRDEARIYRDQGKGSFTTNHHVRLGASWRMSELNAAVGAVHLRRLKEFVETRRRVAQRYDAALAGLDGLQPITEPTGSRSNYYKYVALLPPGVDRAAFKQTVAEDFGVRLSGEVYDLPLHLQPVLAPYRRGPLPVAEDLCARQICLPVHSDMTEDETDQVIEAVTAVHRRLAG